MGLGGLSGFSTTGQCRSRRHSNQSHHIFSASENNTSFGCRRYISSERRTNSPFIFPCASRSISIMKHAQEPHVQALRVPTETTKPTKSRSLWTAIKSHFHSPTFPVSSYRNNWGNANNVSPTVFATVTVPYQYCAGGFDIDFIHIGSLHSIRYGSSHSICFLLDNL